jgi:hypothetical protein
MGAKRLIDVFLQILNARNLTAVTSKYHHLFSPGIEPSDEVNWDATLEIGIDSDERSEQGKRSRPTLGSLAVIPEGSAVVIGRRECGEEDFESRDGRGCWIAPCQTLATAGIPLFPAFGFPDRPVWGLDSS